MPDLAKKDKPANNNSLIEIERIDDELEKYYKHKFSIQLSFNRSDQAIKTRPIYRWYKFREAFSATLIEFLFQKYGVTKGKLLDPFAGSGTALFTGSALGLDADGIELLPVGQQIISTKKLLDNEFTDTDFETLRRWIKSKIWRYSEIQSSLPELRITKSAYPEGTKVSIEKYLSACQKENDKVRQVLKFALLCILESISYTRKDGQYLRWDYRSGHKQGKKAFDKGNILDFDQAISAKIAEIVSDLQPDAEQVSSFPVKFAQGSIQLFSNSCLTILPGIASEKYDAILTSPPYCNLYDYTKIYALELALLGIGEKGFSNLRQEMLSCTVENRAKDLLQINPDWKIALRTAERQELLQSILKYLENQKAGKLSKNSSIPSMVRGYFYEMACVIWECARVLKHKAPFFMVNDNVRFAGVNISVDLILCSLAENFGFSVENILVLPDGKGNRSQQMGKCGRAELRECIYVWRKI